MEQDGPQRQDVETLMSNDCNGLQSCALAASAYPMQEGAIGTRQTWKWQWSGVEFATRLVSFLDVHAMRPNSCQ